MKSSLSQLGFAALAFLAVVALYFWWLSSVNGERAQADALTAQIATANDTKARVAEARTELTSLTSEEAAVESYFVRSADVVPFLETLASTGSRIGASVDIVSVAAVGNAAPELSVVINVSGRFDAVMRTLGAIEHAPYDLTISSVSVAERDTGGWSALATIIVGSASSTPVVASSTHATSTP